MVEEPGLAFPRAASALRRFLSVLPGLRPRDRGALLLGIVVIGLAAAFGHGWPAWRSWSSDSRKEAIERLAELARADAAIAGMPAIRAKLAALAERSEALDELVLDARGTASASASFAGMIDDAGKATGVRITAVHVRVDSSAAATGRDGVTHGPGRELIRLRARIEATADVVAQASLLAWLEENPPMVVVRELSVSAPDPFATDGVPEMLRITMTVDALARTSTLGRAREAASQ